MDSNPLIKTKKTFDIVIAGAGTPGSSLALLLADQGLSVALIDRVEPSRPEKIKPNGRSVALLNSSLNVLSVAGLTDFGANHGGRLEGMRIIDDSVPGQESVWADFPASDIGQESYGYNIPTGLLNAYLYHTAKAHKDITFLIGSPLSDYSIENNMVSARLENEQIIKTPLLIGADGRHSVVRKCAQIKTWEKDYDQSAITCLINHSRSHQNIATEFHRPSGPLAFVPLPGNQSTIVWVEKTERANELLHLKKDEFTHALQKASNDILGAITLETGPESWPLKTLKAKKLTAPRVALMAEAAHVLSPITAQGLNLSLRDVATLAEVIIDAARLGLDYGSEAILKNYEKRRMLDLNSRVGGVDGMMELVSTNQRAIKALRRSGFKFLDKVTPLRKIATSQALSPNLDAGRLVAGEAL